jgi:hypothetical protein
VDERKIFYVQHKSGVSIEYTFVNECFKFEKVKKNHTEVNFSENYGVYMVNINCYEPGNFENLMDICIKQAKQQYVHVVSESKSR